MAQYIEKSAVVAEIEGLLDFGKYHEEYDCAYCAGNNGALFALKNKIDTLEVRNEDLKEVLKGIINGAMADAEKSLNKTNDKSDYICYKIFKYLKENM